jgi:uncharacterized membrane protein
MLVNWLLASTIILLIDIPWLLFQMPNSQKMVSKIQGSPLRFRAWAAIPVYIALGYLLLQQTSVLGAVASGLAVYAVYDFTNVAIFDAYPIKTAVEDCLWGGFLFGIAYTIHRMAMPSVKGLVSALGGK